MVETSPPTPTLNEACEVVDPDPEDVWSYEAFPDEVGGTVFVDAWVPEGYVIGATGQRYWSSVEGGWEFTCFVSEPEPEPEPTTEPEPEPTTEPAPTSPEAGSNPPADENLDAINSGSPILAETGPEEDQAILLITAAMVILGFGGGLIAHDIRKRRKATK